MSRFCLAGCRVLGLFLVLVAAAGVSRGQTQLRMKFTPGETLKYVQDMENKMDMGAAGKMEQNMGMEMTMQVNSVDEEGTAEVTQVIRRIKMSMVLPPPVNAEVSFDSDEPGEVKVDNPIIKQLASVMTPMIGGKVTMKINASGETSDVELDEQLTKHFDSLPKQPGGQGIDANKLKEMMSQMTQPLPKDEIKQGDTWDRSLSTEMPPLGKMEAKYEYTYEGQDEEGLERIKVAGDVEMKSDEKSPIKVAMKDQELGGYLLFDNKLGRMQKAVIDQKFKLEMEVGQKITIDADTKVTITLTPMDEAQESEGKKKEKPAEPKKEASPGKSKPKETPKKPKAPANPGSSP